MALAVRALTANTRDAGTGTTTSDTISSISGIVTGDLVVVEVYFSGGSTPTLSATTPSTGWTKVQEHSPASGYDVATFVRIAASAETSYTFTSSSPTGAWGENVLAYSGGQLPIDVSAFATGSASPLTTPAETTTVSGDWEYVAHTTFNSPKTFNAITNFTKRADNAGANQPVASYDTNATVSVGSQGATSLTVTTPGSWSGHRMAISPSAGGAATPLKYVYAPQYRN